MKISLITACRNGAATLRTALDSVSRQTHADLEHVIIDGASTDGSQTLIRSHAEKSPARVRWLSEPDNGMYDALNKGIAMATGEVVGILNADDILAHENVLARVAASFAPGVDAVYADIQFVDAATLLRPVRYYSSRYFRPWLARFGYLPAHPSFYCRRALFEKFGAYAGGYRIAADHELLIRLLARHKIRARYVRGVFVKMRPGGLSTRSWGGTLLLNRENIRACRANGIHTNWVFQLGKYVFKIPGMVLRDGY